MTPERITNETVIRRGDVIRFPEAFAFSDCVVMDIESIAGHRTVYHMGRPHGKVSISGELWLAYERIQYMSHHQLVSAGYIRVDSGRMDRIGTSPD